MNRIIPIVLLTLMSFLRNMDPPRGEFLIIMDPPL